MNLGSLPKSQKKTISNGKAGNHQTLNEMKKVARKESGDPLIRKLATNILDYYQTDHMNYIDEATAIGKWVQHNVKYVRDSRYYETLHSPKLLIKEILQNGFTHGDCDCMSTLIATLLLSIGQQPFFRAVNFKPEMKSYQHVYVVTYDHNYKERKKRLVIDAILKEPIGHEIRHCQGIELKI